MIEKLKQELNDKGYTVKIRESWMQVKQDKELGDVDITYWKSDKTIRVNSFVELEVLETAVKLFKEIDNVKNV